MADEDPEYQEKLRRIREVALDVLEGRITRATHGVELFEEDSIFRALWFLRSYDEEWLIAQRDDERYPKECRELLDAVMPRS